MAGLYPEFTRERTYHVTGWREKWAGVVTLNQHFKSNGYTTVGLGKIYHGSSGPGVDPDNWTAWVKVVGKEYANPESYEAQKQAQAIRSPRKRGKHRGPSTEASKAEDGFHHDGQRAKAGAVWLKELANADKPFFWRLALPNRICPSLRRKNTGISTTLRISRCLGQASPPAIRILPGMPSQGKSIPIVTSLPRNLPPSSPKN